MANPVGRPTMYNDEMQAKAEHYMYEWAGLGDAIPSRVGLCCYLGISKQTSYDWEDAHPQFLDTCKAIEALQEREAVNKGITGVFNSQITKLVLANHGYSDKSIQEHSGPNGSPIKTENSWTVQPVTTKDK